MRSHSITVIEVTHHGGIEANRLPTLSIHANAHPPGVVDSLHGAQVTVGDLQLPVRRCELNSVADGELPLDLSIGRDATETRWGIGNLCSVEFLHADKILVWVRGNHRGIAVALYA